jgi:hypothetical protein
LLASNQLAGAMEAQQQIILDLRAALQRLRDALGVDETHPYAKSLQARELAEQQRELRQRTEQADLNETTVADELSQQQKDIHQEIAALKEALADLPRQRQLADEAEQAAYEAESHLFQADRQAALSKQQQAIERLEQLAESLDGSDQLDQASPGEQGVDSEWDQLQQLDRELAALDEQQAQVLQQAPNQPAAARQLEQQVAGRLEEAARREPLSPAVRQSVQAAAAAAQEATEALEDASPSGRQERTAAARETKQALQQARELTQARLEELAQSSPPASADLVQAAEDLERVARVEQDLAEVAETGQLDRELLNQQIETQTQAARTVHDVAEQVQASAPAVSSQLGKIETKMQQLGHSLQSMQGAEQIPAPQAAAVAQGAGRTATDLLQMASQLRQQVAGWEPDGQSSSQSAESQLSQVAQNQGTPAATEAESRASGESQPSETNQTAPSESGNRLTSDQGRVRDGTVTDEGRSLQDSPWFAKLPPALRESIRARTRRRAPRGYEERLRRYFESVDKR